MGCAGVDVSDEEVNTTYKALTKLYNDIQKKKESINGQNGRHLFQIPQFNIQLPKMELPKIEMPQIRFQSPFVFEKKKRADEKKSNELNLDQSSEKE